MPMKHRYVPHSRPAPLWLAPGPSWNTDPAFGNAGANGQAGKLLAMIGGIRHGIKYTSPPVLPPEGERKWIIR
jgi:hypothetical protein